MTRKELNEELLKIANNLSPNASYIFELVTEAIMKEVPEGSMYSQDIVEGLEAVVKVTKLHSNPNLAKGH